MVQGERKDGRGSGGSFGGPCRGFFDVRRGLSGLGLERRGWSGLELAESRAGHAAGAAADGGAFTGLFAAAMLGAAAAGVAGFLLRVGGAKDNREDPNEEEPEGETGRAHTCFGGVEESQLHIVQCTIQIGLGQCWWLSRCGWFKV